MIFWQTVPGSEHWQGMPKKVKSKVTRVGQIEILSVVHQH